MRAAAADLFPFCKPGLMDVSAFVPAGMFPWPVRQSTGASQVKLVRDSEGKWFLLAFHSNPPDDPNGTDYVGLHGVRFEPFAISYRLDKVHPTFKPGDTGFASTATRHVEPSGRLLVSSSYRWAENKLLHRAGQLARTGLVQRPYRHERQIRIRGSSPQPGLTVRPGPALRGTEQPRPQQPRRLALNMSIVPGVEASVTRLPDSCERWGIDAAESRHRK
jgi:hypothetical protein